MTVGAYVRFDEWTVNYNGEVDVDETRLEARHTQQWSALDGRVIVDDELGTRSGQVMWAGTQFSADPTELLGQLSEGHPIASMGTGELFTAIIDLYLESNPSPRVRAGLLNVIAGAHDVVSLGSTIDRAGRTGAAFAVTTLMSGLNSRMILIIDQTTGQLLDAEEVLLAAGKLPVHVPAVVSYKIFYPHAGAAPEPPRPAPSH